MRTLMGFLVLLLCFTPAAVDLPVGSRQSTGQLDAQKQAPSGRKARDIPPAVRYAFLKVLVLLPNM